MTIIVRIIGGLGNQMFQYALARSLDERREEPVRIDITAFEQHYDTWPYELDKLQIPEDMIADTSTLQDIAPNGLIDTGLIKAQNQLRRIIPDQGLEVSRLPRGRRRIREAETAYFEFQPRVFEVPEDSYLIGYWQHPRYFDSIQEVLQQELQVATDFKGRNAEAVQEMGETSSASIHLRRGDYLDHPKAASVCTEDYYQRAVDRIKDVAGEDTVFYVFSDDIEWAKDNLDLDADLRFVDWNRDDDSHLDMFLMSHCDHNIIANSTFSWWGAWLNTNEDKTVIAPDPWRLDTDPKPYPEHWTPITDKKALNGNNGQGSTG